MKSRDVSFSADRSVDAQPYRAVSPLAIIACILGAASVLALVHPLFWLLPAAAVVVSALALRSISRNADALVGRKVALAGLALAAFFGALAPSRVALQRVVIPRHARHFAQYWLELVRDGRVHEAHQWTIPPDYRLPADVELQEFYESDTNAKKDLQVFLDDPVLAALLRAGRAATPRFVRTVDVVGDGEKSRTTLDFEMSTDSQAAKPFDVRLVIERTLAEPDRAVQWRMVQVRSRTVEND